MSSIVLSNPFILPSPPPVETGNQNASPIAVAPSVGAGASGSPRDSTSYSGSEHRKGPDHDRADRVLKNALQKGDPAQIVKASPKSVVEAQAQTTSGQDAAKANLNDPLDPIAIASKASRFDPETERAEVMAMLPDPLPTSPFLKKAV